MTMYKVVQVQEYERGLLFSQGRFVKVLEAGRYGLVGPFLNEQIVKVDVRLVSVSVPGQEILTKDKLPVRWTVIAQYRVADPVAAVLKVKDAVGALYEELQLAARGLVAAETLETLLDRKEKLAEELKAAVAPKAARFGIELALVGLKDVTLPAEIRALFAKVAEAEKAAQAALVTAREELA
ncbi:MAG: slipin family protein, partial [Elusimicrobia bacterium]|nr:slipin family protein [Elusimicrobiota bacterium]